MQRKCKVVNLVILIVVVVSCTYKKSLEQVQESVQATVAGLPVMDTFDIVATIPENFTYGRAPDICYYGRVFVVYGTLLSSEIALELYITRLQESGWQITRDDPKNKVWLLARGENEWISVGTLFGPIITSNDVYKEAENDYDTEFLVTVEYMLPSVESCR